MMSGEVCNLEDVDSIRNHRHDVPSAQMKKPIEKPPTTAQEDHYFSSERPIRSIAQDELGRAGFARAVAKGIAQWAGRDSLVLAIYGPWGSGKSSLKNMILGALSEISAKTIFLEF